MTEPVQPGRQALLAMDEVLAKKPEKDGHALSRATASLVEYRDAITPAVWAAAPACEKERLARLNAIISVVMALHFPIGEAPWDDFATARDGLAKLLDTMPLVTR